MTTIKFYKRKDPYGFLSNFARYPVTLDGFYWMTSEHYYQAQKFLDEKLRKKVREAPNPMVAANIGRDKKNPLRFDWEEIKDDVMRKVVLAKFQQHPELRKQLLETGQAKLVEHTANDSYWGDGGDGSGKNMLGKILMEIRGILNRERSDQCSMK